MRKKTPHAVVTFANTADAMAVQNAANEGRVSGRMIPVPSEISAGCGLAWCVPAAGQAALERELAQGRFTYDKITLVDLY